MKRILLTALILLAAPLGAWGQTPVPGFVVNSAYVDGEMPVIQVTVQHSSARDRVSAVALVKPSGNVVYAHRIESERVVENRQSAGGPSFGLGIGGGFGVGGGGHVGTGVGIGVPLGGGYAEERLVEVRSEAQIMVTDAADYRDRWQDYAVRITVTRDDGTVNVARIDAPPP